MKRPLFATVVHPDEYDYLKDFDDVVEAANKRFKEDHQDFAPPYCLLDIGKVVGLVMAYRDCLKQCEMQGELIKGLKNAAVQLLEVPEITEDDQQVYYRFNDELPPDKVVVIPVDEYEHLLKHTDGGLG